MKTHKYILPNVWILICLAGILVWSCEFKEEPAQKIFKAKPENAPVEKGKDEEILQPEVVPASTDSIPPSEIELVVPSDSISKSIQDTTETLDIEKKIEIKTYKKIYLYNLHRKSPVS